MGDDIEALRALSERHGVPGIDLSQIAIPLAHLAIVPREVAESRRILSVLARGERVFLAMADPSDTRAIDEVEFVSGKRVYPYVALPNTLSDTITQAYDAWARGEAYYLGPNVPEETLRQLGLPTSVLGSRSVPAPSTSATSYSISAPSGSGPAARSNAKASPSAPSRATDPVARSSTTPASPPQRSRPAAVPPPVPGARGAANRDATGERPPSSRSPELREAPSVSPNSPAVVVDARLKNSADRTEISVSDFGALTADISAVAILPEELHVAKAPGFGEGKLVLVVDDEEDIRKLLQRLLTQKGFRVIEADRGSVALRLVKEHRPDVIVLDAMLPEIHGFDIAKRIKGSERYGSIPIVMVSAVYKGWHIAEDLKTNYGIDEYVEKPFKIGDVVAAISRLLAMPAGAKAGGNVRDPEGLNEDAERALNEGVAAYRAGDMDRAVEHLRRGISVDPLAYRLHFHLALLYGKRGQIYEAIHELEKAVDLNPKHFAALKNLAVLYEKAGFKHKAVEIWTRCVQLAPDDATRSFVKQHLVDLL